MLEQDSLTLAEVKTFVFFLCPDYPMVPVASAVEVLSAANVVMGRDYYQWKFASVDGEPVPAANGIPVNVDLSLADLRKLILTGSKPEAIMVCAGVDVDRFENKSMSAMLRETIRQKIRVGGISTGPFLLAASGILKERFCVVHWEIVDQFKQRFPEVYVKGDLYEIDDQICTCAGGLAALDMMLALIGVNHSRNSVQLICSRLHVDRIRSPNQKQRLLKSAINVTDKFLIGVIDLMEKNIADPLSIEDIARLMNCSRRQIERRFQSELNSSPALFYLKVRLQYADYQLRSSTKPLKQISEEVGFGYFSHFSRAYKSHYGLSPRDVRNESQVEIAS
ncbi:MAG: GlxA family transcriptional regulator [Pseudomonadota bacterium]